MILLAHKTEILEGSDAEVLGKIQGQLLNALELLQTYQEGKGYYKVVSHSFTVIFC